MPSQVGSDLKVGDSWRCALSRSQFRNIGVSGEQYASDDHSPKGRAPTCRPYWTQHPNPPQPTFSRVDLFQTADRSGYFLYATILAKQYCCMRPTRRTNSIYLPRQFCGLVACVWARWWRGVPARRKLRPVAIERQVSLPVTIGSTRCSVMSLYN